MYASTICCYGGNTESNEPGVLVSDLMTDLKDVRGHCYCASILLTLFIRHARASSYIKRAHRVKTQQNIVLMAATLTSCENICVGCMVTPTFLSVDHLLF